MHPYSKGLLESVPTLGGDPDADLFSIPGSPPDLAALPTGCAFAPRCTDHSARCDETWRVTLLIFCWRAVLVDKTAMARRESG